MQRAAARVARMDRKGYRVITRSAPIKRTRLKPKPRRARRARAGDNEPYKAWLREQRCMICIPPRNCGIVEAAHVGDRGLGKKCPDLQAVPLGAGHHRLYKDAHHGPLGKRFWAHHGLDRDTMIALYNAGFEMEGGK